VSPVFEKGGFGRRSIEAMGTRKRIGLVAGAGAGAAAVVALRRRKAGTRQATVPEAGPSPIGRAYLDHLAEAVRIPTVTYEDWDRVDESQLARFREFLLDTYPLVSDHLEWEIVAQHSLLYRWPGADPTVPPILLMGHYDVVPVEPGTEHTWEHPPFEGVEDDEYLWGRGALDDKGAVIALFEAVQSLLAAGFTPQATVYLSIGHDEEIGGARGASVVARLLAERGIHFQFVLDEGGAVADDLLPGIDRPIGLIGVGEKGYANIEITAEGSGGHPSTPPPHTAVGMVAATIAALEATPMRAHMEVQEELFGTLAKALPQPQRFFLKYFDRLAGLLERRLSAAPMTNALIRTTGAATVVSGGVKPNLLPQKAQAIVNFRILQGDTIDDVLEHVQSVAAHGVTVRALMEGFTSDPSPLSPTNTASYDLIADTIVETFPGTVPAPTILMPATDSRHFAPIADAVYRFAPFRGKPEDMRRVHGTNERFRVADADAAVGFYRRLIEKAAGSG
jgi:carboxypeptidase PM20D1